MLHVAITRARHRVVVLADAARPSPFLGELTARHPASLRHRRAARRRPPPSRDAAARPRPAPGRRPRRLRPRCEPGGWSAAGSDKVPAYVVLSDRHLQGIAVARPTSLRELRGLPGIGPTKLEPYGEEILAVLEPFSVPA